METWLISIVNHFECNVIRLDVASEPVGDTNFINSLRCVFLFILFFVRKFKESSLWLTVVPFRIEKPRCASPCARQHWPTADVWHWLVIVSTQNLGVTPHVNDLEERLVLQHDSRVDCNNQSQMNNAAVSRERNIVYHNKKTKINSRWDSHERIFGSNRLEHLIATLAHNTILCREALLLLATPVWVLLERVDPVLYRLLRDMHSSNLFEAHSSFVPRCPLKQNNAARAKIKTRRHTQARARADAQRTCLLVPFWCSGGCDLRLLLRCRHCRRQQRPGVREYQPRPSLSRSALAFVVGLLALLRSTCD